MRQPPEIVIENPPDLLSAAAGLIKVLTDLDIIMPGISVGIFMRGRSYAELLAAVKKEQPKNEAPVSSN